MQTVLLTLIRCRLLWRLIWVYTVCKCPFYETLGLTGFIRIFACNLGDTFSYSATYLFLAIHVTGCLLCPIGPINFFCLFVCLFVVVFFFCFFFFCFFLCVCVCLFFFFLCVFFFFLLLFFLLLFFVVIFSEFSNFYPIRIPAFFLQFSQEFGQYFSYNH